jgi:putative phage-type endonuclease
VNDGSNEETWLADRQQLLTATDLAAILGLSPYSTPLDVWQSKQKGAQPIEENRFTIFGKRQENNVADWYEADHPELGKLHPSPGLLASIDYPFIGATPDRERLSDDGGRSVFEIKTGSEYTKDSWFEEYSKAPTAPLQYQVQVQAQIFVGDYDFGQIGAFIGGNHLLEPRRIDRDNTFIDLMLDQAAAWHDRHIVKGEMPEPSRLDNVKALYPVTGQKVIEATPAMLKLIEKRNRLQPRLSQGKKLDDALKGDLQALMKDATDIVHPDTGKTLVTWNHGVKPSSYFDANQFAIDHPDLYLEYVATKQGARTMYFKK